MSISASSEGRHPNHDATRVTHLEELCFWLFLVNSGSVQQDWFRSLYFRTWVVGSVIAVTYMPLVTIFTRSDPLKVRRCSPVAPSIAADGT